MPGKRRAKTRSRCWKTRNQHRNLPSQTWIATAGRLCTIQIEGLDWNYSHSVSLPRLGVSTAEPFFTKSISLFPSSVSCPQAYTAVRRFPRPVPCQHRPYAHSSPSGYPLPAHNTSSRPQLNLEHRCAAQPLLPAVPVPSLGPLRLAPSRAALVPWRAPAVLSLPPPLTPSCPPPPSSHHPPCANPPSPPARVSLPSLPSSLPLPHATQCAASPLSHPVQWPLPVWLRIPQKVGGGVETHTPLVWSASGVPVRSSSPPLAGRACRPLFGLPRLSLSRSIAGSNVEPFPHQFNLYQNILLTYQSQSCIVTCRTHWPTGSWRRFN
jgi:hypothetical protein